VDQLSKWRVVQVLEGHDVTDVSGTRIEWEPPSEREASRIVGVTLPDDDQILWQTPQLFRVSAESRGRRVEIEAESRSGGRARRVTLDGAWLDASDLQSIPLPQLVNEGLRRVTFFLTHRGEIVNVADATAAELREFRKKVLPSRNAWKGSRLTDDQLREVARAYEAMLMFGSRRPTQDIADATDTPRSTVARWVGEARKRGLLPPAERGGIASA
jgi:hypothetical protein